MLDFIKNKFQSLTKNKKTVVSFCLVFVLFALLVWFGTDVVWAASNDNNIAAGEKTAGIIAIIISTIAGWLINIFGAIFSSILNVVVAVANYNDFSNAQAIVLGWVVVRDICNMFFILILLVIAFAVILRIDGYDVKKMIPKLLIMAVLINFSRTICGLIIDAAQVVMLTFIHSIKGMGGHLVDMFGIKDYQTFSKDSKGNPNSGQIVVASVLAIIFMLIATVVVIALLGVLVMRIIMLWIYVTLSPLAFFLASFPQGKKYSQKWWSEFSENVIVGPVLAFFLWLSFATLGSVTDGSKLLGPDVDLSSGSPSGLTGILSGSNVMKFAISIGMLLGGLMISSSMAGAAGGFAGKAMGKIQAGAAWTKRKTLGAAKTAAVATGGAALGVAAVTGKSLDRFGGGMVNAGLKKAGLSKGNNSILADRGLIGGSFSAVRGGTSNLMAKVKETISKNRTLNDDIYQSQFNKDGIVEHRGEKYKVNSSGEYQRIDDKGNHVSPTEANAFLTNADGKRVKKGAMNSFAIQAFKRSMREATSGSRAASNALEEKNIEEAKNKIKTSGMSNEEARRRMESSGTTAIEKKALVMHLAEEKGFESIDQRERAQKILGGNESLVKKFGDTVVKNQVHLAYNLNAVDKKGNPDTDKRALERNRMMKDLSKNNIDVRNLSKEAIGDTAFMDAVHDWAGDSKFSNIMKANAEAGGKKNQENVVNALSRKVDRTKLKTDKFAKIQADISGDLSLAFNLQNDGKGGVDTAAVAQYLATAKPKQLESIDNDAMDKLMNVLSGSQRTGIQNAIGKSVSYAQIKSIYKSGNQELAKRLKDDILNIGGNAAVDIRGDAELMSL